MCKAPESPSIVGRHEEYKFHKPNILQRENERTTSSWRTDGCKLNKSRMSITKFLNEIKDAEVELHQPEIGAFVK